MTVQDSKDHATTPSASEVSRSETKKAYAAPKLTVYGTLAAMTHGDKPGNLDSGGLTSKTAFKYA